MRPTLPLSEWRIAVDLNASRAIRSATGHPAEHCTCVDCEAWRSVVPDAFPAGIAAELQRLGVDVRHPTDLYVYDRSAETLGYRVMYHVVGRILSGPAPWLDSDMYGVDDRFHNYHAVQAKPTWVGLRVSAARDSFEYAPDLPVGCRSAVLCIDFRLRVIVTGA